MASPRRRCSCSSSADCGCADPRAEQPAATGAAGRRWARCAARSAMPRLSPRRSPWVRAFPASFGLWHARHDARDLAILIYLWFRFEWQFALGAMIANVHDIVLTIGFMSISQVDFDLTSIAALLTILGYSLNDTVVIYDRNPRNAAALQEDADAATAQRVHQLDAVALDHHPLHGDAGACWRCCCSAATAIHSFTAVMMSAWCWSAPTPRSSSRRRS